MSKTRAELINQCLTNLGVIASGQSIDADLVLKMDGFIDPAVLCLPARYLLCAGRGKRGPG
jgi:hypothetical protein